MTLILRHFSAAADSALLRPDEITPAIDSQLKDQTKIPSPPFLSLYLFWSFFLNLFRPTFSILSFLVLKE